MKSFTALTLAGLAAFLASCADFNNVKEEDIVGKVVQVDSSSLLCKKVNVDVEVKRSGKTLHYDICTSIPAGSPEYEELQYCPTFQFHVVPRKRVDGSFMKISDNHHALGPYYDAIAITPTRTFPDNIDITTNVWKFYSGLDAGTVCEGSDILFLMIES